MKTASVVVIHPRYPMLRALKSLLETEFEVVAMVDNAISLMDAVETLHPDLAVVDVSVRSHGENKLARHLVDRYPDMHVIVIGDESDETVVAEILSWGSSGYVLKQFATTDLIPAAREAMQGGTYVSPHCGSGDLRDPDRSGEERE